MLHMGKINQRSPSHHDLFKDLSGDFNWGLFQEKKAWGDGTELENGVTTNTILSFFMLHIDILGNTPIYLISIDFSSTPPLPPPPMPFFLVQPWDLQADSPSTSSRRKSSLVMSRPPRVRPIPSSSWQIHHFIVTVHCCLSKSSY